MRGAGRGSDSRRALGLAVLVAVLGALCFLPASAAAQGSADPYCVGDYRSPALVGGPPIRFGIDPELAGSVGGVQTAAKPEDDAKRQAALTALRPAGKELVLRINRLFWSDGEDGIRRFEAIVARDTGAGYDVELQVRYHPDQQQQGDLAAWESYVRHVVDVFGPNPRVVAMTITNEVNLNVSPNTSDGSFPGARDALIRGIEAARDEADRRGFGRLRFGFTYAYRWVPSSDAALWQYLRSQGGPRFAAALDFVGLDLYPGSFFPPAVVPPATYRSTTLTALATMRRCFMAQAGLPASIPIWLTENGFPTTLGVHSEAQQVDVMNQMIGAVCQASGTYNVSDYRWFNLRDNDSSGLGLFDTDGLLRDDYSPKPSFARYRQWIASCGAAAAAPPSPSAPAGRSHVRRPHVRLLGVRRGCRRRPFTVTVRASAPAGRRLRYARLTLDGRRLRGSRRAGFRARVDPRRLRPGRHVLRASAATSAKQTATVARRFVVCRPAPPRRSSRPRFTG